MIITITGPSGSGKTTLVRQLKMRMNTSPGFRIDDIVSTTTRPKRRQEIDGMDYYFRDEKYVETHDFIELVKFNGYYYGIEKKEVLSKMSKNDRVLAVVDQHGMKALKSAGLRAVASVYLSVPPETALIRLIRRDGADSAVARYMYDKAHGLYNSEGYDHIVANNHMERALAEMARIIL